MAMMTVHLTKYQRNSNENPVNLTDLILCWCSHAPVKPTAPVTIFTAAPTRACIPALATTATRIHEPLDTKHDELCHHASHGEATVLAHSPGLMKLKLKLLAMRLARAHCHFPPPLLRGKRRS